MSDLKLNVHIIIHYRIYYIHYTVSNAIYKSSVSKIKACTGNSYSLPKPAKQSQAKHKQQ